MNMTSTRGEPATERSRKRKYTKKACDACRARKIKCNYSNTDNSASCDSCGQLDRPCTQERPRKQRGPASRREIELRLQLATQPSSSSSATPRSVTAPSLQQPAPFELASLSQHSASSTENVNASVVDAQSSESNRNVQVSVYLEHLAPLDTIREVVDDWFEFVHPVAPILHRSTFLHKLDQHVSLPSSDLDFTILVISVCAATVSTLRRRTMSYAPAITVERCHQLIQPLEASLTRSVVTLERCQWKYNMSASLLPSEGLDSINTQLRSVEVTSMVTNMLHYQLDRISSLDQELIKRLYWLVYAGACTFGLHGRPFITPVIPFASIDSIRPRDILDRELHTGVEVQTAWHGDSNSYIPGLNALADLFILWHKSQAGDSSDVMRLRKYLDLALSSLDDLSPALRWRGGLSRPLRSNFGTDVQMVNLYITQIQIRSFLLEQIHTAAQNQGTELVQDTISSRQDLINDMLAIAYQMPQETLEANGHSLIAKLRDVGLTLLNDTNSSDQASANLNKLLDKLDRLDIRRDDATSIDTTSPLTHMTSPGFALGQFLRPP